MVWVQPDTWDRHLSSVGELFLANIDHSLPELFLAMSFHFLIYLSFTGSWGSITFGVVWRDEEKSCIGTVHYFWHHQGYYRTRSRDINIYDIFLTGLLSRSLLSQKIFTHHIISLMQVLCNYVKRSCYMTNLQLVLIQLRLPWLKISSALFTLKVKIHLGSLGRSHHMLLSHTNIVPSKGQLTGNCHNPYSLLIAVVY